MRYEYKLVGQGFPVKGTLSDAEAEINSLSSQGWRVVACVARKDQAIWTLERKLHAQQDSAL